MTLLRWRSWLLRVSRPALWSMVRSAVVRPVAAEQAADTFRRGWWKAVSGEIRWAFTPPRAWLAGVGANLVLSLAWLVVQPVRAEGRQDWVVLIGSYFASFILADVTTTNALGVDAVRVQAARARGVRLWRMLVAKNLALLLIVGAPTLLLAVVLTLLDEPWTRLAVTVPNVVVPMLAWLGVGNIVSVVLPVAYEPLRHRWRERRSVRATTRWLVHLLMPYALFYLVDPVEGLPHAWLFRQLSWLGPVPRSLEHAGAGAATWLFGTMIAVIIVRLRGLPIR